MIRPSLENKTKQERVDFENYKINERDIKTLEQGLEILVRSGLVEEEILNNIRFVTYYSKNFYFLHEESMFLMKGLLWKKYHLQIKRAFEYLKFRILVLSGKAKETIEEAELGFFTMQ
jgi:hypothetical protein